MIFLILGIGMVLAGDVIFQQGNFIYGGNISLNDNYIHNSNDINSNQDLDIYPNNQFTTGLRIGNDSAGNLLLTALGTSRINFSDAINIKLDDSNSFLVEQADGDDIFRIDTSSDTIYTGFIRPRIDDSSNVRQYDRRYKRGYFSSDIYSNGSIHANYLYANTSVGIGTNSPLGTLQVSGLNNGAIDSVFFDDDYGTSTFFNRRTQPTTSGQRLGYIIFSAYDGVDTDSGAPQIQALTEGAWSDTSHPSYLDFRTVPYNSVTPQSRLLISSDGNITIDTSTLFIDAVNNRIGIGTKTPKHPLHVSGDANVTGTIYYGALVANSPHMFGADEQGYTRICVYDKLGFWNMVYWEDGIQKVDKNNKECKDKEARLEQVKIARENCETQNKIFNENDQSCSQKVID
ncbi:hypothetical protein COU57_04375 [Candidatus Pacearchaeota archaeon CG10_big_fil_rev_8_21_14_0_10_32_14]|nr:MAG: hypothetical protein COU57_04375 [Candidatus Pacearchaeota archaeon CG10_big_fil_rev_8_21_14_0_10_32_14]